MLGIVFCLLFGWHKVVEVLVEDPVPITKVFCLNCDKGWEINWTEGAYGTDE